MKGSAKTPGAGNKFGNALDAVSENRNWVDLIENELRCADAWEGDWGFLAGGKEKMKEFATKHFTIEDRIRMKEEEMNKIGKPNMFTTCNQSYGTRDHVDVRVKENNIHKQPDLMPLTRKLPDKWKKEIKYPEPDPWDANRKFLKPKKSKKNSDD